MGKRESGIGVTSPSPNAVVLRPGQELPPCLETVLVVTTERGCVSVCATHTYWSWVDVRDAANHPICNAQDSAPLPPP